MHLNQWGYPSEITISFQGTEGMERNINHEQTFKLLITHKYTYTHSETWTPGKNQARPNKDVWSDHEQKCGKWNGLLDMLKSYIPPHIPHAFVLSGWTLISLRSPK